MRRRDLTAALLWTATRPLLAGAQQAQPVGPPPHQHGPKVFLDYDQVELDAAYNQASYAANARQVQARYASNSALARKRLGEPLRMAYGKTEIEKLDVYRAKRGPAPVQVLIHGGAWRGGLARDYAFIAESFAAAGAHFVVPDFVWVQNAGGDLAVMADQVRRAIAWVCENAATFGGDPARVFVSAHSSGAHLAACALTAGSPLPVQGALLISGMYDLKAPRLSSRREYVEFTDMIEESLSPQRHIENLRSPLIVAYASLDTPEFQRQSREFAAAAKAAGKSVELVVGENYNHFELPETLGNPHGLMGRAALRQMGLAPL